jgi:hypothetical protein
MALQIEGLLFDTLAADPGAPAEGQVWYNSTSSLFKIYRGGVTSSFTDAAQLLAHTSNVSNPHTTTLEQARSAGSTLAGPINMGGFSITNVAQGSAPTDGANRQFVSDQVKQALRGLDWQESVLNRLATPPASPVTGARYMIIATATGAWAAKENQLVEWDGTAWVFTICTEGATVRDETGNLIYTFDGTAWANFGNAVQHSALLGLTGDDHTQYLRADGTRTMTGALNMGTQNITMAANATVDGVDVSTHAARHQPGGADALTTAAAVTVDASTANGAGSSTSLARADHTHDVDTVNGTISTIQVGAAAAEGTGNGLARRDHTHAVVSGTPVAITDSTNTDGTATTLSHSDHVHAHGNRGGGALHAVVGNVATGNGFHPASNFIATTNPTVSNDGSQGYSAGSRWINTSTQSEYVCIAATVGAAVWQLVTNVAAGFLASKAGKAPAASFTGSPKKLTITFTTPFADINYSVSVTPVTQNGATYNPVVESQLAGSFVINMGTANVGNLLFANWQAIKVGEST